MIFQAAVVNGREVYFCKPGSKVGLSDHISNLPTEMKLHGEFAGRFE